MHGGSLEIGSRQVPKGELNRPMFSHPLLFHHPSQRCLVLVFVMHVVARWQMCLHPSHIYFAKGRVASSVIHRDRGKEQKQAWGGCLVIQLSSLQGQGLELGAQKPCKTRSCVLLRAIVSSGMGNRDRKAAEVHWPLSLA